MKFVHIPHRYVSAAAVLTALSISTGCISRRMKYADYEPPSMLPPAVALDLQRLKGPLQIDTLVSLALRYDPQLQVLRSDLDVANAIRSVAIQIPDPELRVAYGKDTDIDSSFETMPGTNAPWYNDSSPEGILKANSLYDERTGTFVDEANVPLTYTSQTPSSGDGESMAVTVRFPLPNPFTSAQRVSAANTSILKARAMIRSREWLLSSEVMKLAETIRKLKGDISTLELYSQVYEDEAKMVEGRVPSGRATVIDAMRASNRHVESILQRDQAERAYKVAMTQLANLTGTIPFSIHIAEQVTDIPLIDAARLDRRRLETLALKHRNDIKAIVWDVQVLAAQLKGKKSESIPWLSYIQASWSTSESSSKRGSATTWTDPSGGTQIIPETSSRYGDGDSDEWSVQASISIPFFSLLSDDAAPEKAMLNRGKAQLTAAWRTAVSDVRTAHANLVIASRSLSTHKTKVDKPLRRMKAMLQNPDTASSMRPDEIRRLNTDILSLQGMREDLEYQYHMAVLALREAVGVDIATIAKQKTAE